MDGNADGGVDILDDGAGLAAGEGKYCWFYGESDNVYINQCIRQTVTVMPGDSLIPNATIVDLTGGELFNTWFEIFLGASEMVEAMDYRDTANGLDKIIGICGFFCSFYTQ